MASAAEASRDMKCHFVELFALLFSTDYFSTEKIKPDAAGAGHNRN